MPTGTANPNRFKSIGDTSPSERLDTPSLNFALGSRQNGYSDLAVLDGIGFSDQSEKTSIDLENSDSFSHREINSSIGSVDDEMSLQNRGLSYKGALVLAPISPGRLTKRRSCELTTKMSPCIEKATFHLYQLQDIVSGKKTIEPIAESEEKADVLCKSSQLPSLSFVGRKASGRIQLKPLKKEKQLSRSSGLLDDLEESTVKTEIQGAGYVIPADADVMLAQFAHDVIEEHLLLLGRLETDRYNTEQALIFERERVKRLRAKIEALAYKRMCDLPVAVQREHEACAYDIQELNWHVSQRQRSRHSTVDKLRVADHAVKEISASIKEMEDNGPSVLEKLQMDKEDIEQIKQWQEEADAQLRKELERLENMEAKYNAANRKGELEKESLKRQVEAIRRNLEKLKNALLDCQTFYDHYINQINSKNKEHDEFDNLVKDCDEQIVQLIQVENEKKAIIEELKENVSEQEKEQKLLEADNVRLEQERKEQVIAFKNHIQKMKLDKHKAFKELLRLFKANDIAELDINQLQKATDEKERQKKNSESARKFAQQRRQKIEMDLKVLEEENAQVRLKIEQLRLKISQLQASFKAEEDGLKASIESLRDKLKGETRMRTILQAKMTAEQNAYQKSLQEANEKKDDMSNKNTRISSAVAQIESQVDKLSKAHADRKKVLEEITNIIKVVNNQHEQTKKKMMAEIVPLQRAEVEDLNEIEALQALLSDLTGKISVMTNKMKDMELSIVHMYKKIESSKEAISELSEEFGELKIQVDGWQKLHRSITKSLKDVEDRQTAAEQQHNKHIAERDALLIKREDELQQLLAINKSLAQRYNLVQDGFLAIKHQFLHTYEKELFAEDTLRNQKELCVLHEHLQKALEWYHRLRGLQSRADVSQFQTWNAENAERLGEIQEAMAITMDKMSHFLTVNKHSQERIWHGVPSTSAVS